MSNTDVTTSSINNDEATTPVTPSLTLVPDLNAEVDPSPTAPESNPEADTGDETTDDPETTEDLPLAAMTAPTSEDNPATDKVITVDVDSWTKYNPINRTGIANKVLFVLSITSLITWSTAATVYYTLLWIDGMPYRTFKSMEANLFMNEDSLARYMFHSAASLFVPLSVAVAYSYDPSNTALYYTLGASLVLSAVVFAVATFNHFHVAYKITVSYHFVKHLVLGLKNIPTRFIGGLVLLASSWILTSS